MRFSEVLGLFNCIIHETIGLRKVRAADDIFKTTFAGNAFEFPACKLCIIIR